MARPVKPLKTDIPPNRTSPDYTAVGNPRRNTLTKGYYNLIKVEFRSGLNRHCANRK